MEQKYKNLAKDTLVFSIGKFGSRLVLFFLVPLYTNYLTKDQYGTADLVFTISQLLTPLFSVVIFDSVIRFGLVKGIKKENVLYNAFLVLAVCVVLSVLSTPLFRFYRGVSDWRGYLPLLIVSATAMDIEMNYLKVIGKNLAYSFISIIQAVVLAGSNIICLVFLKMGVDGYLLSTSLSYFSGVLLAFFVGRLYREIRNASFDKKLLRQMMLFSAPLILNNISWWVIQSSDKLMLEMIISASALGLYTAATKIPSLINVVISIFQQAWGISSIKEIESTNDTSFYSSVFKFFSTAIWTCCILLNCIIKPFMFFYVGAEFRTAWRFAPLLIASAGFSGISSFFGAMNSALKKSINNMITSVVAAIVNILVNLIMIHFVGIWGAIIGTIISYVLVAYLRIYYCLGIIKIDLGLRKFFLNSIYILIQAILISVGVNAIAVSLAVVVLFGVTNYQVIYSFLLKLKRRKNSQI